MSVDNSMSVDHRSHDIIAALSGCADGPTLPKAPTGIPGLDEITEGGFPLGRTTLVSGRAGSGKTLMGLQFLVAGATKYGEPGLLVTFEESAAKVAANVTSLGFDLNKLQEDGQLVILAFQLDPAEIVETGAFDFEPLFLVIADAVDRIGVRRVVLDTIEVLFGAFTDEAIVRAELARLLRWLEERELTAIVTGEQGQSTLTRHGVEEYVSDCVIVLDHRVAAEVCTRRLRVLKYRGSVHGTNEYPFVIGARGFVVLPITSVSLSYSAPSVRVSSGVARLDHMLSGGFYGGSTVLITGQAGTGKSTLGAHLIDAACSRGERSLLILFEESPEQVLRNMRSVGIDLRQWVDAGLLRIWAARPTTFGMEAHLAVLAQLVAEVAPSVAVLDGIGGFISGSTPHEVTTMISRQIDLLKSRGITAMVTSIADQDASSGVGVSSLVDTWILLRNVEQNGERNRLLFILKSRGTAHSNQVREFVLTDHGAELIDVYVGAQGVLAGSARLMQETRESAEAEQLVEELAHARRELARRIAEGEARLSILRDELAEQRLDADALESGRVRRRSVLASSQAAMAEWRWADPDDAGGFPDA